MSHALKPGPEEQRSFIRSLSLVCGREYLSQKWHSKKQNWPRQERHSFLTFLRNCNHTILYNTYIFDLSELNPRTYILYSILYYLHYLSLNHNNHIATFYKNLSIHTLCSKWIELTPNQVLEVSLYHWFCKTISKNTVLLSSKYSTTKDTLSWITYWRSRLMVLYFQKIVQKLLFCKIVDICFCFFDSLSSRSVNFHRLLGLTFGNRRRAFYIFMKKRWHLKALKQTLASHKFLQEHATIPRAVTSEVFMQSKFIKLIKHLACW